MNSIEENLSELGLSETEAKIYIALTEIGESGATRIARSCALPRTTVISALQKLADQNYISIHKYRGRSMYWIESPKMLTQHLQSKLKIAQGLESQLDDLYRTSSDLPYAQIFDTPESIKAFIQKILTETPPGSTIYTIENPSAGNYRKILSDTFYYAMLDLKVKKSIKTHTLIHGTTSEISKEKISLQDIEIRTLDASIAFHSSFWIIGDTLVHFSGTHPFVVAINHQIITSSMKSIYDFLWIHSF